MTLRHLKIFVSVCECGGVTLAAEKLYLAQPSVSLAIRELEEFYDTRLFDRIARRLRLTDSGQKLLSYASHIVSMCDQMEREMRSRDSVGNLRVGSSITIGTCLLPKLVRRFTDEHPCVKVRVTMDNSRQIARLVLENSLDFALVEGVPEEVQLVYEKFLDDELVFVCGNDSPLADRAFVTAEELAQCQFLLREKGSGARELFDSCMLLHHIAVEPLWESISTQAILNAVEQGVGVSVLPLRLAEPSLEQGLVRRVRLEGISFDRHFYIVRHKNKYLSVPMQEFIALCRMNADFIRLPM